MRVLLLEPRCHTAAACDKRFREASPFGLGTLCGTLPPMQFGKSRGADVQGCLEFNKGYLYTFGPLRDVWQEAKRPPTGVHTDKHHLRTTFITVDVSMPEPRSLT